MTNGMVYLGRWVLQPGSFSYYGECMGRVLWVILLGCALLAAEQQPAPEASMCGAACRQLCQLCRTSVACFKCYWLLSWRL
jgi:hypothetical protein